MCWTLNTNQQANLLQQHRTGVAKKIWSLESPEDIAKWIEERKRYAWFLLDFSNNSYNNSNNNERISRVPFHVKHA